MRFKACICTAALAFLALSCGLREENLRPTIPYAEEIIDGGRARERQLLETVSEPEPSGNICIIGTYDACYGYADYLAAYDVRDNVSGAHLTDGLPDFAGETIVCIADAEPFTGYVASGDTLELRRQSAMRLICALDTLVHISPYDLDGFGGKAPAKLVVVADPGLCEYGMFDIDTLKAATGNHIPVVSPLDMMLDGVFGSRPGRTLSLGIIYDPEIAGEDIYRTRFRRAAAANGVPGSQCLMFPASEPDSLLHRLVESYAAQGVRKPLDAVIVDAPRIAPDSLRMELADILSVMNESSLTYGRMLSRDFVMVRGLDTVAEYCYNWLRLHNLFTHDIAYPQLALYRPAPSPDSEDGSIILISDLYVQN